MDHIIHYDPGIPEGTPSPCFIVDIQRLEDNVRILDEVQKSAGCKILCALKGFAMHNLFPLLSDRLAGVCASGPHEAQLGSEFFGKEVHVYAPAFSEQDMTEIIPISHHITFNSFRQFELHRNAIQSTARNISCGLRVNPGYSEVEVPLYDPCAEGTRLGIPIEGFENHSLDGIDGLHFHALCEQNSDTFARVLEAFEDRFAEWLPQLKWVNFGGGHHITSLLYDRDLLVRTLRLFKNRYPNLTVYLEPGEAIAINTGILLATVLDIIPDDPEIAILDISATCHMPDVLEMPYRPEIFGGSPSSEKPHTYRLGGLSCLAGDIIGDYSFENPLRTGDKVQFLDMAHYTMVKTTTFNGIKHPSIATWDPRKRSLKIVRNFGYEDYRDRLS